MHRTRLENDLDPPETTVSPPAPTDTVRGSRLYGRRAECQALDRLLADVRAGQSRVMIIRGKAGAGKTALLDYLAERASGSGCRVARMVGVQSEMGLAFAGLHQCAPMLIDPGGLHQATERLAGSDPAAGAAGRGRSVR
jgi:hypothetical protein